MSEPKNILLTVDGELREVTHGTTGLDLFREKPTTAVMRVDGLLWDLAREIPAGASVESVDITEPEGLEVLRHSTAHVMAQAVQQLRPGAKLGIGPYITDGFYFDFDVDEPFTPEDLKQISSLMQKIVKSGQTFRRRVVDEETARAEMADEPYKLELLGKKDAADTAGEGASVEVGAGEITIYDNVDPVSYTHLRAHET